MVTVCLPTLTFVPTALHDGRLTLMVVPSFKSQCSGPPEHLSTDQWTLYQPSQYQRSMGPLHSKISGLEMMSICLCSSIQIAAGTRIQQHGQQIRAHLFVICLKTLTCFTVRLIQVTTTMSSRERAMLKHASTQVKKNSGMAVYITSIWMQATFRAAWAK